MHRGLGLLRRQQRQTLDGAQRAIHAGHRMCAGLQVKVRAIVVDEIAEGSVEIQGH